MDRVSIDECIGKAALTRPEIGVLYFLYIVPRLSECGDAMSPVNGPLSSIVRRQGQIQVAIVSF